jgi:CubicO group peptidase (beta-lactamase class C family)
MSHPGTDIKYMFDTNDALLRAVQFSSENWLVSDLESLNEVPGLLEDRGVPGLSLAFVTGPGAAPVTGAWGSASAGSSRPVTPETVFRAGSVSKPATALAALALAG